MRTEATLVVGDDRADVVVETLLELFDVNLLRMNQKVSVDV